MYDLTTVARFFPVRRLPRGAMVLLGLALVILFTPCAAPAQKKGEEPPPPPTERPFLWRIEGKTPSYMFGTIHVPNARVSIMPDIVAKAIENSDVVLTEVRLDKMGGVGKAMLLGGRKTLKDIVPAETYSRLEGHVKARGLPMQMFNRQKIWVVMTQLMMVDMMKKGRGYKAIDQVIWNEGRDLDKEMDSLEELEEQIGVFESFSDVEQAEMLAETLDLLDEMKETGRDFISELIDVYREGDASKLQDFMEQMSGVSKNEELEAKFTKLLIDDRNIRMADRMVEKMRAAPDKSFFFAVGAAHYPGELGILNLLAKKGYRVTRLPTTADYLELLQRVRLLERRIAELEKQKKAG